jgi:hypothetical protein
MIQSESELSQVLVETKQWCIPRINRSNPGYSLRSELLGKIIEKFEHFTDFEDYWPRHNEIDIVAAARQNALLKNEINFHNTNNGRLLLCFPDWSNNNALSQAESEEYLDEHDVPPWDTWLGSVNTGRTGFLLLAWVPDEFIDLVQAGIEAECVGMLYWANSKYWGQWSTPDQETLNLIPEWVLKHHAAKT